jgi:7-keto-8-aminopelargonate synthetase-like enzyme
MEIENGAKSKHDQILSLLDEVSISGKKLGIILQTIEDSELDGRHVTVKGNKMKNFSSCSYLGLDLDQRLMAGAIDAVSRFWCAVFFFQIVFVFAVVW